jgi:hypothetical protein
VRNCDIRNTRLIALVVFLAGAAHALGGQAKLEVLPESWNFGEAWHGTTPKTELMIRNAGDADLQLTRVKAC